MNYHPDTATYKLDHWLRKEGPFLFRVLSKGQTLRFSIEHEREGTIKLTENEGKQLMKALMHYFNREVQSSTGSANK